MTTNTTLSTAPGLSEALKVAVYCIDFTLQTAPSDTEHLDIDPIDLPAHHQTWRRDLSRARKVIAEIHSDEKGYFNHHEMSKLAGLSRSEIILLCKQRKIRARFINGYWVVRKGDFNAWLNLRNGGGS